MSITQALSELKLLNARISKLTMNSNFTFAHLHGTKVDNKFTPEEAKLEILSTYDSITSLIKRRNSIKSLIVESNASTRITIGKVEMSVAEAIERKSSIIYEQHLLNNMKHNFDKSTAMINRGNEKAREVAQKSLDTVLGKDGSQKPSESDIKTIFNPVYERYEYKLIDPLNISKVIKELESKIEDFNHNVDYALSTSNAITQIEID